MNVTIYPMIIGDSAFPFRTWLLKPYTNHSLTEQQRYFNYRSSRARMVSQGGICAIVGKIRKSSNTIR